jgi:signal transduction histidine kinase
MSAKLQIDTTYNNLVTFLEKAEAITERQPDGTIDFTLPDNWIDTPFIRRNDLRISATIFFATNEYHLQNKRDTSEETHEIVQVLKDANVSITNLQNQLVRTYSGVYFVSAFRAPDRPMTEAGYFIIYANVTGLKIFSAMINTFLIIIVCVMFIITAFLTFFLSKSITRPIEKLGMFASKIGQGDFAPSDFKFMDEEFESLNNVLNNSARQLNIYDSEQKTFFQNVSHELRTPLMSIQCQAEGITFNLMEPQKASETILQETQRLSELVTDLLYISKIDNITTAYKTEKVDLTEIIRSCAQRQQTVADKKGISFEFEFSEPIIEYECICELISRAIDNLISNAIRYAASKIILTCEKKLHQITISVIDDGNGIEPESMPYIFDRFYKGNGGNHGIGLSIAKTIAEQHRGSITAKNTEQGGALFTITLPLIRWE